MAAGAHQHAIAGAGLGPARRTNAALAAAAAALGAALALCSPRGAAAQSRSCPPGTFAVEGPTVQCHAYRTCQPGTRVKRWGSATEDRECEACPPGTFTAAPNRLACSPYNDCPPGTYVSGGPTAFAGRSCLPCQTLVTFTELPNQPVCLPVDDCPPGTHVSRLPTRAANRRCSPCPPGALSWGTNQHRCNAKTPCASGEYQVSLGTTTTDRRCAQVTATCDTPFVEVAPVTATSDRRCEENRCLRPGEYSHCPYDAPVCMFTRENGGLVFHCVAENTTSTATPVPTTIAAQAADSGSDDDRTFDIIVIAVCVVVGLTVVMFFVRFSNREKVDDKDQAIVSPSFMDAQDPVQHGQTIDFGSRGESSTDAHHGYAQRQPSPAGIVFHNPRFVGGSNDPYSLPVTPLHSLPATPLDSMPATPRAGNSGTSTPDRARHGTLPLGVQPTLPPAAVMSRHLWFHGPTLGKEGDAAKLRDAGGDVPNGTFFISEVGPDAPERPGWVLVAKFKGRATRHLIKDVTGDGVLSVNLKRYGEFRSLDELVEAVSSETLPPGWPIRLTHTIDPRTNRTVPLVDPASLVEADTSAYRHLWFHGVTRGKSEDAARLKGAEGELHDGTFFVCEVAEDSPERPAWVLNVMFKNRATRHLIKDVTGDGVLSVNLKKFGDFRTVEQLIAAVAADTPPEGWPMRLTHTVDPQTNHVVALTDVDVAAQAPVDRSAVGHVWYHGPTLGKDEDAERLVNAKGVLHDGTFFVCDVAENAPEHPAWALVVVFKNRPTRHLIKDVTGDGVLSVNLKKYGDFRTLEQLIAAVAAETPPEGWPVRLTHTVDPQTNKIVALMTSAETAAHRLPVPADTSGVGEPWFHGVTQGKEADAAALGASDGAGLDGTFFVCEVEPDSPDSPGWVLNAVFEGRPTRHLIKDVVGNGVLTVNLRPYGDHKTLDDLVAALTAEETPAGWPVRLTHTIDSRTGALIDVAGGAPPPLAGALDTAEISAVLPVWHHGTTAGKEGDFAKLVDYADKPISDGTFFACEVAEDSPDFPAWVLNIVFRGKPTRHLVKDMAGDGTLRVNNVVYGAFTSLDEIVDAMSAETDELPQGWPVRLTHTVDASTGAQVPL